MEENFTMYDIADRLGWKYIQRSKGYIKCPFCGTEKLACNIDAKFFSCLKCNHKGNFYQIYADLYGISDTDGLKRTQIAARELRNMFGSGYVSRTRKEIEESEPEAERRPVEELDKVYCDLIRITSLSDAHKKALMDRGLTERQIQAYGFRTVDPSMSAEICRKLMKRGHKLEGIPGFYFDTFNNEWRMNTWSMAGIYCICPDENGYIQGFQIRLDKPKRDQKYMWLSSKDKLQGASSSSPAAYFGNRKATKLVVVDGILKACVCNCFNDDKDTAFIGIAGAVNYKHMVKMITRLKERGITHVYNAYDVDELMKPVCNGNYKEKCASCELNRHANDLIKSECPKKKEKTDGLKRGSKHLEDLANELGLYYKRITWNMDKEGYWKEEIKGLDDYLLSLRLERRDKYEERL